MASSVAAQRLPAPDAAARETQARIIDEAMKDSSAWNRLALLADNFGNRPTGSDRLEKAIDWIVSEMKKDGLDNVHTEIVPVSHWVRGAESALLVSPRLDTLHMLGLGKSVGTNRGPITAQVLVVKDFDDLRAHATQAKGKIVLFDFPFSKSKPAFAAYGEAVMYRGVGADSAMHYGAVAMLVRSVTPMSLRTPHTGALRYGDSTHRIPAAAVSVEDAEMLHRMQDRGQKVVVRLSMGARFLPMTKSRNIVAEVTGTDHPEEVVILGGHIDSWDVGMGAMDDGGGSVAAWEAVRLIKKLGIEPRRTIRVVLWTNEESGLAGGTGYAKAHEAEIKDIILAMESDNGVFAPRGIFVAGSDSVLEAIKPIALPLARLGVTRVDKGESEADVSPLFALGVPALSINTDDSKYFWYHHTDADTPDKLDPVEMQACMAVMAVIGYGAAW